MKKALHAALLALIPYFAQAQETPHLLWAHSFGNTYFDGVSAVMTDTDKNMFVGGYIGLSVDMDPGAGEFLLNGGNRAALIGKYTENGTLTWAAIFKSNYESQVLDIAKDATGNLYIVGSFRGTCDFNPGAGVYNISTAVTPYSANDIFITKLTPEGNFIWAKAIKSIATTLKSANAVAVDNAGNVYIAGMFNDTIDFDPGTGVYNLSPLGSSDAYMAKYDTNGNFVWAKQFGAPNKPATAAKIITDGTSVYLGGGFSGTIDFNPGEGTLNLTSHSSYVYVNDIFIGKYAAADGALVWAKNIGSSIDSRLNDLELDPQGNLISTGYTNTGTDFDPGEAEFYLGAAASSGFVLKLNNNGGFVWATGPRVSLLSIGLSVATDSAGNIYTGGTFTGTQSFSDETQPVFTSFGDRDLYLTKLSPDAQTLWQKQIGSTDYEEMIQIAPNADGSVYIGGNFRETLGFSPDVTTATLTASGSNDLFIARYGFEDAAATPEVSPDSGITVYPNPSGGILHIIAPESAYGTRAALYNMAGQKVLDFSLEKTLNTGNLPTGVYLLNSQTPNRSYSLKIMIQ